MINPNELVNRVTKRELFAAMAMQGLSSSETYAGAKYDDVAKHAVRQADALIDALNK